MLKPLNILTILMYAALASKMYSTSSSKISTSAESAKTHACALWTKYNDDDEPSVNGFAFGTSHLSNVTAYVGIGYIEGFIQPARIQITASTVGSERWTPGGYTELITEHELIQAEYLVVADGCTCQWIKPLIGFNHTGFVITPDATYKFAIGRKTFPDGRVQITKVFTSNMTQCYSLTTATRVCNETVSELLVCETNSSTAGPPKIKFKSESCGMWSSIGMQFSASNAISAGLSIASNATVNITAFVGRGQYNGDYAIGRYQDTNKIGSYITTGLDEYFVEYGSQWLIVPQNCSCHWMHPEQGKTRKGVVTSIGKNYMVGRKILSNEIVSVAKVWNVSSIQGWWANLNKKSDHGVIGEILVCETIQPTSLYACALWTRYNYDDAPSINGFSAGISVISNTTAYVGMGMYGKWIQPARIQITPDSLVGGFTIWSKDIKVNYPEYLVIPEGCKCSWIAPSNATNRAIILTGDPEVGFAVGRKTFADGRVAISKVITVVNSSDYMRQWYNPTTETEITNELATEILICETTESTANPPKIKFSNESCGVWSSIGMINSAAFNGFAAGQSIVNDTALVGRGQKENRFIPGRYQTTNDAGTYVTYNSNEKLVDFSSQWLVVPQNCFCYWVHLESAIGRIGLVTAPDYLYNFMIGLKRFSNGLVSISRVKNETWEWFTHLDKTEGSGKASEVLVCETLAPISKACALWTRYNGDDAPSINGFSAGISYFSNTAAYVGMGMKYNERIPARIQIQNSTVAKEVKLSGAYGSFGSEEKIIYSEYLVVPDGCKCFWKEPEVASNRAIIITNIRWAVGRKTFTDGRVGLTKVSMDDWRQCYNPTPTTSSCGDPATEILICEVSKSTSDRPKVKFSSESCGMWSSIGTVDSSATNGFSAGQSIVNNTAYIGRGKKGNQFIPGRYQNTTNVGTYVNTNGAEELVDYGSQWLIVPENCSCSWMHPDQAKIRKGLITVPDQTYNFMVGRKTFSNGLVSIMSVVNVYGLSERVTLGWYSNVDKTKGEDCATEVLVCETFPLPTSNACALWTRYNGDDGPSINGFSAGISYLSNITKLYVGLGMHSECVLPARIEISSSGGYVPYDTEVHVPHVEYLVVPDGCQCSWMLPSLASNHPGLIFTGNPSQRWIIGRKTFPNGHVALTRVTTSAKLVLYMTQWYNPTSTTIVTDEPATELLVCEISALTAGRPKVNLTTESCGMWSTIGMVNPAAFNGFSAGQSKANNTAYIGRGQKEFQFVVGQYRVENQTGTFVNVSGIEELVDYGLQWLVVPQNCSCHWIASNKVKNQKGLITIPDELHIFMISRKTFSNGEISISKVNSTADNSTEILICTTLK